MTFLTSFLQGRFPNKLKVASVVPIYKSDNRTLLTSYRSILVLPVFFQKIMFNRITDFVTKNKILNDNRYGFREQRSTYMALLQLLGKVTNELDNNHYSIRVFLNLSKAFDTINHGILIDKLQCYGIRGVATNWIHNYHLNRSQYVCINGVNSPINCGIPQGFILGPLLFILYINDIAQISKTMKLILFADNTNICMSDKCFDS